MVLKIIDKNDLDKKFVEMEISQQSMVLKKDDFDKCVGIEISLNLTSQKSILNNWW